MVGEESEVRDRGRGRGEEGERAQSPMRLLREKEQFKLTGWGGTQVASERRSRGPDALERDWPSIALPPPSLGK